MAGGPVVTGFKITPRTPTTLTTSVVFTVTYQDSNGVDPTSFDVRDLRVTGPNGFVRYARAFLSAANPEGTIRVARYKIAPPGDSPTWNNLHNGIYSIRLQGGAVSDMLGNFNDPVRLGSFVCAIPVTRGLSQSSPFSMTSRPFEAASHSLLDPGILKDTL
jgi:hypothetical protein